MAVPARPVEGAPVDTTWGGIAHDTAVAQDIQTGTGTGTLGTAGTQLDIAVTFPRAFASAPVVMLAIAQGRNAIVSLPGGPTASGFTARVFAANLGNIAAGTYSVYWFAIGPRA